MTDPRGTATPVYSGVSHPFLDALHERVLVFDGAFGTFMQGHDLGPDDFGGEALEGCNEQLVLTRPDLVAQMHDEFFNVGCDAVETATFGAFPLVLNEYAIADRTFEINRRAAEIAVRLRRATRPTAALASSSGRSGPARGCRPSVRFATPICATVIKRKSTGCLRAVSTSS